MQQDTRRNSGSDTVKAGCNWDGILVQGFPEAQSQGPSSAQDELGAVGVLGSLGYMRLKVKWGWGKRQKE